MQIGFIQFVYDDEDGVCGMGPAQLTFTIDYCFIPGQPEVWRDREGHGCPRTSDEIELYNFVCTQVDDRVAPPLPLVNQEFDGFVQTNSKLREQIEEQVRKDLQDE